MKIEFFYQCLLPTGTHQQEKKVTKSGRVYISAAGKAMEAMFRAIMEKYRPAEKLGPAVVVSVAFTWPHTKESAKSGALVRKVSKPDLENYHKFVGDAGTKAGWWEDDCRIAELHLAKYHGEFPGIAVCAEQVELAEVTDESH